MLPIKDINRSLTVPHVTHMLIIINVTIFLVIFLSSYGLIESKFMAGLGESLAIYPYYILRGGRLHTLLTSMFVHADWFHLFGNMLFLYVFGDNVEDIFGHVKYLIFYMICGLAASFVYIMSLQSFSPVESVVGASGAISGVLGAYLVLFPRAKILTIVFYGWVILVPLPAVIFLGFWFLMQWLYVFFALESNVAWWAHIGGFVVGMVLALVFGLKRKKAREARLRR